MPKRLVVQKFGGTSVGSVLSIKNSAEIVKREIESGSDVVVVVSAMSGVTKSLIQKVHEVSELRDCEQLAEYDSILSSGEQVSSGLFALMLASMGFKSRSWLGWQLPVITDMLHGCSSIIDVNVEGVKKNIKEGVVPIVAGFQGLCKERITTLGRGGSDITAVALAVALDADCCDIYTDVEGVFSADPRIVSNPTRIAELGYEAMLELASTGAKVLHPRAVGLAMKYMMKLRVISSVNPKESKTVISDECGDNMEKSLIAGVSLVNDEVLFSVLSSDCQAVLSLLSSEGVIIYTVIQNLGSNKVDFTVKSTDKLRVLSLIKDFESEVHDKIVLISIVGSGMMFNVGVVTLLFTSLASNSIAILGVTTSEIKVTVLLHEDYGDKALRVVHSAFGLGK